MNIKQYSMDTDALRLLPKKQFLQTIVDFILSKNMLRFLGCMEINADYIYMVSQKLYKKRERL